MLILISVIDLILNQRLEREEADKKISETTENYQISL
jgi:hypothetical protein